MNLDTLLEKNLNDCRTYILKGKVASYIPELEKVDCEKFGICLYTGKATHCAGDWNIPFTMQSIIKPIILLLALQDVGIENIRKLVGIEATGKPFDAFNYSDQALKSEHINPMVNAGAIALCTLIKGDTYSNKFNRILKFVQDLTGNSALGIDEKVYLSEQKTGNKNRALAYMLNAYGMIDEDVENLTDFYFRCCSIKATCKDLAHIAYILAKHENKGIVSAEDARYVNAIMMTSGMYDGSGEFALNVGIPAKSGVGGGIMAVVPNRFGIGVYSPALDNKGNSLAGRKLLECLSKQFNWSIF